MTQNHKITNSNWQVDRDDTDINDGIIDNVKSVTKPIKAMSASVFSAAPADP